MKNIFWRVFAGLFMPVTIYSTIYAYNITPEGIEVRKFDRPYKIDIIEANGNISNELTGISEEKDPFLIAKDIGANPFPEDRFKAFPDIKMGIGSKITLHRAPAIKIKDGKRSKEVRSWQKSIGELFSEQKIEIGKDDKVNFTSDTNVEDGMEVAITRVAITTVVEKEAIDYKTVKKSNPNVEKGNKKTLQVGRKGTKNKYYLVRREDGEEVSRTLTKTEVAEEPTEEIVEVGTKVLVYGSGVASIWKKDSGMVSACNFVSRGTKIHVINMDNGKSVDVTCMGGGLRNDRLVDLSDTAFQALGGSWSQGLLKNVRAEKYYPE